MSWASEIVNNLQAEYRQKERKATLIEMRHNLWEIKRGKAYGTVGK